MHSRAPVSRAPGIPGNENGRSRPGNKKHVRECIHYPHLALSTTEELNTKCSLAAEDATFLTTAGPPVVRPIARRYNRGIRQTANPGVGT